jgi:hypothetical protein
MVTPSNFYKPWPQQAAEIKERMAQPVIVDGVRFVCTRDASAICGISMSHLRHLAATMPGDGIHTLPNGLTFLRQSRCKTDLRSPLYWREDSLR